MKKLLVVILVLLSFISYGQMSKYGIELEPVTIDGLEGLQSYSFAQHQGDWLIVGGRLDGLHKRRPFESFTASGDNKEIWVVNPTLKKVWTASISTLPVAIQEQLGSTNHNFIQDANKLIITGGYGYSNTFGDHTTYKGLIAVDVSQTIDAVKNNKSFTGYFKAISDTLFKVTGGRLDKINDKFYLVGGQNFEGRYNPMGPDHGPGFTQVYSNQIRKFKLSYNPLAFTLEGIHTDAQNLHRRDYNVVPQIMPNGKEGLTAFSGVFQEAVNLPFLNCVNITADTFIVNNDFTQYYNHYHCATVAVYDSAVNEMSTVFLGGIARYFDVDGVLTVDDDVPFVKSIARVTRDKDGQMIETLLDAEMPDYLGAGSEFIANPSLLKFHNGVIKFNNFSTDKIELGYIFGGIKSTAPNVFFSNDAVVSEAANKVYKVSLVKKGVGSINEHAKQSSLQFQVFPNPSTSVFNVQFYIKSTSNVNIEIHSLDGKVVQQTNLGKLMPKLHNVALEFNRDLLAGTYFLTLSTDYNEVTHKVILK